MNLKLHHLNLSTTNVPAMDEFYRSVLGLEPEPTLAPARIIQGYGADVRRAFRTRTTAPGR
jgi:catechol 2,3-dioxygenase-like lactoylglutathione lyase family enzyme